MKKIWYAKTNANHELYFRDDESERYEVYTCDGTDDFPILDDEDDAIEYLRKIGEDTDNLGGPDNYTDNVEEFDAWIDFYDSENAQRAGCEIIAELDLGKHYFIVDDCLSSSREIYDKMINADNDEEAIDMALAIWNRLSRYDQERRDRFWVAKAKVDENGCIDYNGAREVYTVKDRG